MLNALYQSLDPIAFSLGPFVVRWYGLAYVFGFVGAGLIMSAVARRWKLNITADDFVITMTAIAFGVIFGARIFYVIFYGAGYYASNPLHALMINQGGMSFHGGLVGALVAGFLVTHFYLKLSFITMADLACIGAPIGLFFGRIANFINGELWGKPTDMPWGVMFETGGGVMRHPSQLYEATLEGLLLFIILYFISRKLPPKPQGTFLGLFLALYGVFRFLIEFVRVPDAQLGYLFGPITMGQLLSLPLVLIGLGILAYAIKQNRPQVGRASE